MLYANTGLAARTRVEASQHALDGATGAVWLDLLNPTDQERSEVERATKLRVPPKDDIAEIESSSRLVSEGEALYLSTPMTFRGRDGQSHVAPLGFVVSADRLITVRFAEMPVFETFAERFVGTAEPCSVSAFTGLLEAIVDRLADVLEFSGAELEQLSHKIFSERHGVVGNASKVDAKLREILMQIGLVGERLSNLRDSLVGMQRIMTYVHDMGGAWIRKDLLHRCNTLQKDVGSLMEFDNQLGNKMQFLLDATLGFINIEQNNGIKVLTVVSVVGIPPTLIASIYGMNFKNIPELQWDYGYAYGLTVIVLSAVVPLILFKWKGWV